MNGAPNAFVLERHEVRRFVLYDLRDGVLDEATIQLSGPPVIGVQPGSRIVRTGDGVAAVMVEPGATSLSLYSAPNISETVLLALVGRGLNFLLETPLITCAALDPRSRIRWVGRNRTPWDGPYARLAERVLPTLAVELESPEPDALASLALRSASTIFSGQLDGGSADRRKFDFISSRPGGLWRGADPKRTKDRGIR